MKSGISLEPLSPAHWFDGNFSLGLLLAIGMYGGFEVTVLFGEEVRNPVRIIPRATFAVIAIAMTIYALSSLMFANSLGIDKVVGLAQADPTAAMNTSIETCQLANTDGMQGLKPGTVLAKSLLAASGAPPTEVVSRGRCNSCW